MRRLVGGVLFVSAFVLPFVIVPRLPERMIDAVAFSYGMQGPTMTIGLPCLILMIQGMRMWSGD